MMKKHGLRLNESRKSEKWRKRQKHEPRMQLVSRNSLVGQVCMFSVSTEPANQRAMNPIEPSNQGANDPIEPSNQRGQRSNRTIEPSSQWSNRTIEPRSQGSNRSIEPRNQRSIRTTELTSYVMIPHLIVGDVDRKAWYRSEWRQLWVLTPR